MGGRRRRSRGRKTRVAQCGVLRGAENKEHLGCVVGQKYGNTSGGHRGQERCRQNVEV